MKSSKSRVLPLILPVEANSSPTSVKAGQSWYVLVSSKKGPPCDPCGSWCMCCAGRFGHGGIVLTQSMSILDAVHVHAWHITEAHVLHLFMMHSSAHSPPLPFSYQDSSLAVGACICSALLTVSQCSLLRAFCVHRCHRLCCQSCLWYNSYICKANRQEHSMKIRKAQDQKHPKARSIVYHHPPSCSHVAM